MPLKIKPYLTGLLCVLEPATCAALARVVKNISHDSLSRILKDKKLEWQILLSGFVSRIAGKLQGGYLIVDDTIVDKSFAKVIENISWIFSSKENRVMLGLNLVMLAWSNSILTMPLGIKIWKKGGKSKYDLALELLAYAKNVLKIRPQYVVFDSWYASEKILSAFLDWRWTFFCQLKKNRKLNDVQLQKFHSYPYWMAQGVLTGGIEVSIVRHGKKYFATNDLSIAKKEILACYRTRWVIETMFRFLHDQLGLEKCQTISLQAQTAHIHLCLIALVLVEKEKEAVRLTGYEILRRRRFDHQKAESLLSAINFRGA